MLNKVMIGRYYPIDSFVHKMNPLAKIICILLFVVMIFLTYDFRFNIIISILFLIFLLRFQYSKNI